MFKKFLNIHKYLNLKDVGVLELVFAFAPMLSGYCLGAITLSALMWIVLLGVVFLQKGKLGMKNFWPLTIFAVYWLIHTIVVELHDHFNVNGAVVQVLLFISVYALYPNMDFRKMKGALNWVAIIAIAGLLYQWTDILRGEMVHPLEIPGLTMSVERLEHLTMRPSSFFMEPASYVAFMICPLAISLMDRKYLWTIIIILSIYLTTSTTGLVGSFIMLVATLLDRKRNIKSYILVIVMGLGLLYVYRHAEAFEYGVNKIENTDTETNVRLVQGRYVVSTMKYAEYYFGVPYSNAYRYCLTGRAPDVIYYGKSVYTSTFWQMILLYGVIGLLLYLNIYLQILRKNWRTLPLVAFLCAVMFSSSYAVGASFIYTLVVLLTMVESKQQH